MTNNRPLYLIIGESGSGKDTIVDRVCEMMRVNKVTSCTTRPRRDGEPEDAHYFIDDAEFDRLLMPPYGMAAVTTYDGYRYGATWAEAEAGDLYIIDPAGAASLDRERLGRPVYEVYVAATENWREQRLYRRYGNHEDTLRRIGHDRDVFSEYRRARGWSVLVNNDTHYGESPGEAAVRVFVQFIVEHWPKEEAPC